MLLPLAIIEFMIGEAGTPGSTILQSHTHHCSITGMRSRVGILTRVCERTQKWYKYVKSPVSVVNSTVPLCMLAARTSRIDPRIGLRSIIGILLASTHSRISDEQPPSSSESMLAPKHSMNSRVEQPVKSISPDSGPFAAKK